HSALRASSGEFSGLMGTSTVVTRSRRTAYRATLLMATWRTASGPSTRAPCTLTCRELAATRHQSLMRATRSVAQKALRGRFRHPNRPVQAVDLPRELVETRQVLVCGRSDGRVRGHVVWR